MRGVSWSAVAALVLGVAALGLGGARWQEHLVLPLVGLAVVLALISLRE